MRQLILTPKFKGAFRKFVRRNPKLQKQLEKKTALQKKGWGGVFSQTNLILPSKQVCLIFVQLGEESNQLNQL